MSAFEIAFYAVIPIFLMIVLGYTAKRLGIVGQVFVKQASSFVFKICLPAMIFSKVAAIDISSSFDVSQIVLMVFCGFAIIFGYFIAKLFGRFFIKASFNERGYVTGAFIQGAFRSNYVIIGYPILLNLFGDAIVVNMALVTIIAILMFNVLSIIALTPSNEHNGLNQLKQIAIKVIKNPLIIAIGLGFLSSVLGIDYNQTYPEFIVRFINMTGDLATPLGLIAIGAFFHFDGFKETIKTTSIAAGVKLMLLPVLMSGLAFLVGLEPMNIILITVLVGGPTAVSSFAMSNELGGDSMLAGNIIIVSSALCVVSLMALITFWVSVLGLS